MIKIISAIVIVLCLFLPLSKCSSVNNADQTAIETPSELAADPLAAEWVVVSSLGQAESNADYLLLLAFLVPILLVVGQLIFSFGFRFFAGAAVLYAAWFIYFIFNKMLAFGDILAAGYLLLLAIALYLISNLWQLFRPPTLVVETVPSSQETD